MPNNLSHTVPGIIEAVDFTIGFQKLPNVGLNQSSLPIRSLNGIFAYMYHKIQLNVGKYTIHGWYGLEVKPTIKIYKKIIVSMFA